MTGGQRHLDRFSSPIRQHLDVRWRQDVHAGPWSVNRIAQACAGTWQLVKTVLKAHLRARRCGCSSCAGDRGFGVGRLLTPRGLNVFWLGFACRIAAANVTVGGDAETATTSEEERQQREIELPSWTAAEFVYGGSHWLWLVNSANTGAMFRLSGWPNEPRVCDAFTGKAVNVGTGSPRELTLPAYGVAAMRWTN